MHPLADALAHWHEFYLLLGTAAGTLVALLFVAASVSSGVFSSDRRAPLRVFLSASVVAFGSILIVSLILLAPVPGWVVLGVMVIACGMVGLTHSALAWRDSVRDGLSKSIDMEDRIWYALLPIVGYLSMMGSGVLLALQVEAGLSTIALALGMLLVVGIHNAWDITIWIVTHRRD